jgi:hypothetical protein
MNQESGKAGKNLSRSYLKATNLEDGLLFNFATAPLTVKRFCREKPPDSVPDLLE